MNLNEFVKIFHCLPQEFDNYAEWDLKDIDFVDDDSDILRGGLNLNWGFFWGGGCF